MIAILQNFIIVQWCNGAMVHWCNGAMGPVGAVLVVVGVVTVVAVRVVRTVVDWQLGGGNINTVCRRWAVATVGSCCQWAVVVGC